MGKRQRSRARTTALTETAPASMRRTLPAGQQMARVNVDRATWAEFRVAALRSGRSVDDYLGELVRRELGR